MVEPAVGSIPSRLIGRRTCSELAVRTPSNLVEQQAGRIEVEAQRGEQGAKPALGIVDQSLVDHAVDRAGLNAIEVANQPDVVGVVTPEVVEVVAEAYRARNAA